MIARHIIPYIAILNAKVQLTLCDKKYLKVESLVDRLPDPFPIPTVMLALVL